MAAQQFNSSFYSAAVTVIPIFFITLAVELNSVRSPLMRRMVALYFYRKLRRFESMRHRLQWLFRGALLLLTALLPVVTVFGWLAELAALLALNRRSDNSWMHTVVEVGVIALPTITLLWAIAMRDREPTPLEAELDELAEQRRRTLRDLGTKVDAMETTAKSGSSADVQRAARQRKRLAALQRRNQRLAKSEDRTRESFRLLRASRRR